MPSHHLSQRHAFPLSARHAADEFIADLGLDRVANTEGIEDAVFGVLHVLILFLGMLFPLSRHLVPQGKLEGLVNGQGRKMDIIWLLVSLLSLGCVIEPPEWRAYPRY